LTEHSITAPALFYLLHPCSRSLTDNGKSNKKFAYRKGAARPVIRKSRSDVL